MRISSDLVLDLFDHMECADAAVWSATLKNAAACSDPQLRTYLLHTSTVQRAFLDAWKDRPFAFRDNYDGATLEAEYVAMRAYYPEARSYIAGLSDAMLEAPMRLPWTAWVEQHFKRPVGVTSLGETMLQVCSHTTHHRGQANARLRALGVQPPMVDYIAWLWRERPQPEWLAAPTGA